YCHTHSGADDRVEHGGNEHTTNDRCYTILNFNPCLYCIFILLCGLEGHEGFTCKITSAISEGINNQIKRLKRMAYGYKDVQYFLLKIHQHC
ncbi:MAG TPA: hypothetical protein EYP21_10095, partial [Syntrophaceae bacterium]|nr:hypothetical protein [Syntrophaceae bacterium]